MGAVILVGAAGLSHEETAAIAGYAVGTIKRRVDRSRSQSVKLGGPQAFGRDVGTEAITVDLDPAGASVIVARAAGLQGGLTGIVCADGHRRAGSSSGGLAND